MAYGETHRLTALRAPYEQRQLGGKLKLGSVSRLVPGSRDPHFSICHHLGECFFPGHSGSLSRLNFAGIHPLAHQLIYRYHRTRSAKIVLESFVCEQTRSVRHLLFMGQLFGRVVEGI